MFFRDSKNKNDQQQIIDLITAYSKTIRNILSYRLHSASEYDLQDCEQEVYLIMFQECNNLLKHPHIKGWICVCCRNVATNYNNKVISKRKQTVEYENDLPDITNLEDMVINKITYDNAMEHHVLEKIIGALSESERILYKLKWHESLSEKDIAIQMNISLSAVKSRTTRLRHKIKRQIKEYT